MGITVTGTKVAGLSYHVKDLCWDQLGWVVHEDVLDRRLGDMPINVAEEHMSIAMIRLQVVVGYWIDGRWYKHFTRWHD
jgi:hypothetical protein